MRKQLTATLILGTMMFTATSVTPPESSTASLGTTVLRGAAIGYIVKQSAGALNKFINTVTLNRKVPSRYPTKVVPIVSVGEKTYVGGAQVSGPQALVDQVKVVWQYEDNFSDNRFRLKVLVPSNSLNPLKISRVEKIGIGALIDVAPTGGWDYNTKSRSISGSDVLLAAGVAVAVKNMGSTLNKGINAISFNKGLSTRVVPMASFGEKAYIGGGQVSGSANTIGQVGAIWQYEDFFSSGKFRVKVLVPSVSSNPLKLSRVHGAGVTAVIDMSLARQQEMWNRNRDRVLYGRTRGWGWDNDDRHDNGLHRGWEQGRHKGWDKDRDRDRDKPKPRANVRDRDREREKIQERLKVKLPF